uniref:Uncharacterized protein n=1 Tax=Klebsiella pneumoniae subsp. pneumoniae TaxID=72407 RepID=A0A8F7PXW9_KLEPN|nr:hypothetical protein [Klebsiella pneumoniae subsp. pneumoniae]QXV91111.1 hypothetical protein [Klebsiella pneumoniae subsp. pneumoniae]QXV91686.1 hypothetical protein [Klebsiella pneumoniae subsp. pneumoniae]
MIEFLFIKNCNQRLSREMILCCFFFLMLIKYFWMNIDGSKLLFLWKNIFTLYVTRM